jgi:hypothetical protein
LSEVLVQLGNADVSVSICDIDIFTVEEESTVVVTGIDGTSQRPVTRWIRSRVDVGILEIYAANPVPISIGRTIAHAAGPDASHVRLLAVLQAVRLWIPEI